MNHLRTAALAVIAFLSLFLAAPYSKAQSPVVDSINFKGATNIFVSHHGIGSPTSSCTGIFEYIQDDDTTGQPIWICQAGTMVHAAGGGNPAAINYAINFSNLGHTAFQGDAGFTFNPLTHTFASTENAVINALSSTPRAIYDPMDTSYDGGLAAAIAGTSGYTPTQVIQAAMDYGECQIQMGTTIFQAVNIPLPSYVTIPITGLHYWSHSSFGGDSDTVGPTLQHTDATQIMLQAANGSNAITCTNGATYHPAAGGVGGVYLHNFQLAGMFNPATNTDIGIWLNAGSSIATNIAGNGQAFGGPAVVSTGTSAFLSRIGFPGSQIQGCKTYNTGVLAVAGFTLGDGRCGSVMDLSLDGGAENLYVSDGQAQPTGHPAGPCYPDCAAFVAGGSGTYDDNIFAQVSGIGAMLDGPNVKAGIIRVDDSSREAVQVGGGTTVEQIIIDTACADTTLQSAYNAGTPTGCFAVSQVGNAGSGAFDISVINSAGIFSPAYVQAWIGDGSNGFSGGANFWGLVRYVGSPDNATANGWMIFNANGNNDQTGPRVFFPSASTMRSTGSTINASGLTSVRLDGNTVTGIVGGIAGQHLTVIGNGTMTNGNGITNLNALNATIVCNGSDDRTCNNALEYLATSSTIWTMIAGPPNQTPTHVNYAGNSTPTNPSLIDVYGSVQARQVPAIGLDVSQIHGSASGSGQACFVEQELFADGSNVVSPLECTTVNLAAQTPGEIFAAVIPEAAPVLWLVSNTEGNGVALGKYPAPVTGPPTFWDGPTTIAAGGDSSTPPAANENNTGSARLAFGVYGPATAPSGICTAGQGGAFVLSQDGHGTYCPTGGGTWTSKF